MSSNAKAPTDTKMDVDGQKKKQIPALGVLEEDDEFEEFPAQDWDDRDTDIANITNSSSGGAKASADNLWEDNWDDDDVEDDFSKQLREEVAKQQASRSSEPQPMTH
ncbi:hypothetical protein RSOLAG1IB_01341 [Rhizoctonia solani AG-1 IB]|uniref:26S proteasome complex subunit SEM1 n=2 Tax=Rhizoctonia solani TaxID=456999 RepID=M5BTD8_THACB|nr:unnamed protein product [Rhizoctonia solani]CCO30484.1 26 proteasome complex subunit DSS1 [Rhizoctonia solani AG-1 IB]CEL55331.1 hypothetical protein RSOLAG1IB_01341 [Rhizoctonia solani AG-1 IB]